MPAKLDPRETHLKDLKQLTFGGENAEAYWSFDGTRLSYQAHSNTQSCDRIFTMRVFDGNTYGLYRGGFLAFALLCGAIVVVVAMLPATRVAQMLSAPWLVGVVCRPESVQAVSPWRAR